MEAEDIKHYTHIDEFKQHLALLDDLMKYPRNMENRSTMTRLKKERKMLITAMDEFNHANGAGWQAVYKEDKRRGDGGGASESDANARASMKQLMKDNRLQKTKGTQEERKKYREELEQWEEKTGKLERLKRRF